MREVLASFEREWRSEFRARHGLFTSLLFSVLAVVAISFACQREKPSPAIAAALLAVVLLFAAIASLPRIFLIEDDQGSFDLLRMASDPAHAFLGKLMFSLVQMLSTGLVLTLIFVALSGIDVEKPWLLAAAVFIECVALASATSLCGALVLGATNRWVLVGVLAVPVLLPQLTMGVLAMRAAIGEGAVELGVQNLLGLFGFCLATLGAGPLLVREVWSVER